MTNRSKGWLSATALCILFWICVVIMLAYLASCAERPKPFTARNLYEELERQGVIKP